MAAYVGLESAVSPLANFSLEHCPRMDEFGLMSHNTYKSSPTAKSSQSKMESLHRN